MDRLDEEAKSAVEDFAPARFADELGKFSDRITHRVVLRALGREVGAPVRDGCRSVAEVVAPLEGTTAMVVRDTTPLVVSQLFDGLLPSVRQLVVHLEVGTLSPPPTHPDWSLVAAINRFGETIEARSANWLAVRAVVYGRRPRAVVVVEARPSLAQPPLEMTVKDHLAAIDEKLAFLLLQRNPDPSPNLGLGRPTMIPVEAAAVADAHVDQRENQQGAPSDGQQVQSGQREVPATPLQGFSAPQH